MSCRCLNLRLFLLRTLQVQFKFLDLLLQVGQLLLEILVDQISVFACQLVNFLLCWSLKSVHSRIERRLVFLGHHSERFLLKFVHLLHLFELVWHEFRLRMLHRVQFSSQIFHIWTQLVNFVRIWNGFITQFWRINPCVVANCRLYLLNSLLFVAFDTFHDICSSVLLHFHNFSNELIQLSLLLLLLDSVPLYCLQKAVLDVCDGRALPRLLAHHLGHLVGQFVLPFSRLAQLLPHLLQVFVELFEAARTFSSHRRVLLNLLAHVLLNYVRIFVDRLAKQINFVLVVCAGPLQVQKLPAQISDLLRSYEGFRGGTTFNFSSWRFSSALSLMGLV